MAINRLDAEKLENGVRNLLKLFENRETTATNLFTSPEPIHLQIDFVKIPRMRKTITRIPLPNSLLTDVSDVCLIVADVKRGRNVPHDMTTNHYTKLLKKRGVMDIQKLSILPSRQIRVEYSTFEARRKLCNMYDLFLIDEKISSYLFSKLGKEFTKSRKWPIPIRIKRKNLKDEILTKLKKTSLSLDGTGTTKTVQIGHKGMTATEITENILSAGNYIMKYFPGGWNNIRSLHIKGRRTAALPIFISLVSPNDVPVPKVKTKKKKRILATDEVSSVGRKVTVYRSGHVMVHDFSGDDSDEYETDENSESDELEKPTEIEKQSVNSKKIKKSEKTSEIENNENDHSDDDEDEVENKYLYHMQKEEEERSSQAAKNEESNEAEESSGKKLKKRNSESHQLKKKKLKTR